MNLESGGGRIPVWKGQSHSWARALRPSAHQGGNLVGQSPLVFVKVKDGGGENLSESWPRIAIGESSSKAFNSSNRGSSSDSARCVSVSRTRAEPGKLTQPAKSKLLPLLLPLLKPLLPLTSLMQPWAYFQHLQSLTSQIPGLASQNPDLTLQIPGLTSKIPGLTSRLPLCGCSIETGAVRTGGSQKHLMHRIPTLKSEPAWAPLCLGTPVPRPKIAILRARG